MKWKTKQRNEKISITALINPLTELLLNPPSEEVKVLTAQLFRAARCLLTAAFFSTGEH